MDKIMQQWAEKFSTPQMKAAAIKAAVGDGGEYFPISYYMTKGKWRVVMYSDQKEMREPILWDVPIRENPVKQAKEIAKERWYHDLWAEIYFQLREVEYEEDRYHPCGKRQVGIREIERLYWRGRVK